MTAKFPNLPENASKEAELNHLRAFLDSLSDGTYLSIAFKDVEPMIADGIRQDIVFGFVEQLNNRDAANARITAELKAVQKQVADLREVTVAKDAQIVELKRIVELNRNDAARAHEDVRQLCDKVDALTGQLALAKADIFDMMFERVNGNAYRIADLKAQMVDALRKIAKQ